MDDGKNRLTIAVVGGGLSGTLAAAHLLGSGTREGAPLLLLRVLLVERDAPRLARGVAYSTEDACHLLNVPACNMSAFPADPDHFLRWCRGAGLETKADTFVPRMTYGVYLESVLDEAAEAGRTAGHTFERIFDEVVSVDADEEASCAMLRLRRRGALYADRVVLAPGNFAPSNPYVPGADDFYRSDRYLRDPWAKGALAGLDLNCPAILLVGTGLTMVDIALSLQERGFRGEIHALSRHGLLPQAHREAAPLPAFDFPAGFDSARALVRAVRDEVRRAHADGHDWRAVANALRPLTQRLWRALSPIEKRRFMRHVRPFWEVHRHRMAPEVAREIEALLAADRLILHAGRILSYEERPRGEVLVTYRPRGERKGRTLTVGYVINCTGPASDVRSLADPLMQHLSEWGYLLPDPLRLGVEVSESGALVNRRGEESETLFVLGPWRRPLLWETTAAPEIRAQAAALANQLCPPAADGRAAMGYVPYEYRGGSRELSVYDWVI